jgi:hypothetical protein
MYYFSDKELGLKPQTNEDINEDVWGGLFTTINSRIQDGSFGYRYSEICPDENKICGCDHHSFSLALKAEIPEISWPMKSHKVPPTLAVLDLLEFCYRAVGTPIETYYHSYFRHSHFEFDSEKGKAMFCKDVNRIFSRNGIAYELEKDGSIIRIAPPVLSEEITSFKFDTGDDELDFLFNSARTKYLNPDPIVRKDSLEKLWDAWERLKSIEHSDKKTSIGILLDKTASEPEFRKKLDEEAYELTQIGNNFRIRHSEITKTPIESSEQIDYLFHRLFALNWLLLKATGRCGHI